jgi:hypothetical protein
MKRDRKTTRSIRDTHRLTLSLSLFLSFFPGNCQVATTETAADGGAVLRGASLAKIVEKLTSESYRGTKRESRGRETEIGMELGRESA